MKYKAIGLAALCGALLVGLLDWQMIFGNADKGRYEQHKDAPAKQACTTRHSEGELCTHLPVISIETQETIPGKAITDEKGKVTGYTTAADGSDRIRGRISTFDSEEKYNHPTDTPTLTSEITIHIRGNSSRTFDKPGYAVNLINSDGTDRAQSMLGMDAHADWVLHGPFIDKSLMRNYMWYNIAGGIMDWAPNVRFCEVTVNGEYMGLYVLCESITAGQDGARLSMSVDVKNNSFSGYVLRLDRGAANPQKNLRTFSKYSLRTKNIIDLVYPGSGKSTPALAEEIRQDFSDFEKALYSYDFDNPGDGYDTYIDTQSFVDYFLINEFTCNYDAGWLSTYIYKDISGKFRMCIWDFNSACDNYQESKMMPNNFEMQNCLWYVMLIKDEDFTDALIKRYRELRGTFFSEEFLYDYIDSCIDYLGPAVERNFEKWGYTFEKENDVLSPAWRNPRSYDEAIESLKSFIAERGEWMDENIESLRQYSAESKIKKFVENAN